MTKFPFPIVTAVCLLLTGRLVCAGPTEDAAIELTQQWAFALVGSAKNQIESGATDPKAIRKEAIEDTQSQEKKLRAAMKGIGMTPQQIDKGINDDRKLYLGDVESDIKTFQAKRPKK